MSSYPLEPDRAEMEVIGRAALEFVTGFVEGRVDAPAADYDGAWELARRLAAEDPPAQGVPFGEVLATIGAAAAKGSDPAGPGYLAYIPGGGLFASAVADLLACSVNRFVNLAGIDPPVAGIEASVVRWLCGLFGLPSRAQGILTSGGSMANLSAIVTARVAHLGDQFADGTLYVSDQAHRSLVKAARIAGFPTDAVRIVPTTPELSLDVDALSVMIDDDRAAGRRPFFVAASAGTTNTGAVDPLAAISALCHDHGLWFHVDAAYGGFFQLTDRGRHAFEGIDTADSITLDPHKGMFLPYGTGSLLVRDGAALLAAHHAGADYLQDLGDEAAIPDFAHYSPELSRDFRGLRVWLPLHLHGVDAFRAALDEKLDLARTVYDGLSTIPTLDVPWDPPLSLVAFRLRDGTDDDNRALLDRINASRRVLLSSTQVDGRFTLRICVLSHRTHADRIAEAIEIIRRASIVA